MQAKHLFRHAMSKRNVRRHHFIHRTNVAKAPAVMILLALVVGLGSVRAAVAGNVTGSTTYGDLTLTGSPQSDRIVIEQLANGTLRVSGRNGTTINGSAYNDFYGFNRNLTVELHDGSDGVTIGDLQSGAELPGEVTINLGNGADTADLQRVEVGGNTTITTGNDYDYVSLSNSHLHQDLLIDLGDAGDAALIQSTQIDGSATITAVGSQGGDDQDIIDFYDVTIGGDLDVETGKGVDGVDLTGVTVGGTATVDTGDHRDHVAVEKMRARALEVRLGNGNDQMDLWHSMIGTVIIDGGEGKDTLCWFENTTEASDPASFEETCR